MKALRNWLVRALYSVGLVKYHPWPIPPAGAVARVCYQYRDNPLYGQVVYRMGDGTLIMMGTGEPWSPGDQFEYLKEEAIA